MSTLQTKLKIAEGGRIVIPAEMRQQLGMDIGNELVIAVEGDHATLTSAKTARKKSRQLVRQYISSDAKLSEELMAERKRAARHE